MLQAKIITFLMAMVPVIELRGAIPYGVVAGLSVPTAFVLAVIGNLVPIPVLVVFTRKVFEWLRTKSNGLDSFVSRLEAKAEKKKDIVLKYEFLGLMILVAIPLPGTGAWTGSLVASLLDVKIKKAVVAELLGICIATVIMSLLMYGLVGNVIS